MKTKKVFKMFLYALVGVAAVLPAVLFAGCKETEDKNYETVVAHHETLGCGGYGAVFNAKIDPFNGEYFGATCDMGGVYFTFDGGESWMRHNVRGTVYCLEYDPCTEGVVWAAGSGVYKSTDHGKTLEIVFPKESDITSLGNNYENANYWIYTDKQSDYAPQYQIWSMAINRKSGGKEVFAAQRVPASGFGYNKCIRIYRTTDGENFSLFTEVEYSYNYKIDYDENNDCLVYATPEKILEIDREGKVAATINMPVYLQFTNGNNMSFDSYYNPQTQKTTFVFSSPLESAHAKSVCYKTQNLRDKNTYEDISSGLIERKVDDLGIAKIAGYNQGRPSYEYCEWINKKTVPQQFKWTISDVSILNENVIYLYHEANSDTFDTDGSSYVNRRTAVYLKYDARKAANERYKWLMGFPHKAYGTAVSNTTWQDSDSDYCFGMTSSPANENALLFCTNVGAYYTSDGETFRQLNSKKLSVDELSLHNQNGDTEKRNNMQRIVTTGLDVICTHTVATDPFNPNHLLMGCTDIGLLQSYDNGESWYHGLYEWQGATLKNITYATYTNTCFALHFDTEREGVVYAIWSTAKTAPYTANNSFLTSAARFGVSYDGGLSWQMKNITPNGNCLPYKMQVVYHGSEREIYISTFSHGFFVTRDLGETFEAMNAGIERTNSGATGAIWGNKILVTKAGTFAITGGAATTDSGQMLYRWNEREKKFEKLGLPMSRRGEKEYRPAAVRDIVYDEKNDCLYLACTANVVNNYTRLEKVAGGIWKYKDGEFTQIYDENISVFGLCLDSKGRLYATEHNGSLIRFDNDNTTYKVLLDDQFPVSKGLCFGANDNIIYLSTWGGGTERVILEQREIKS